jgi:DNA-binding LacI/PurR family transcriptional regulator
MTITLADLAREANVDVSTVSRALNGRAGVRREVRERVLEAACRLNYRPNLVARGLVTGTSNAIGLLVSDIRNPFFAEMARGAEDAAYQSGYDIVLCNSDLDPTKQMRYFLSLLDKRVGGIIMNSVAPLSQMDRKQIASSKTPVVLLSRAPRERGFSSVTCDNERGGYLAGAYLAGLGHTVVAHLSGSVHHPNLDERWRGFVKAMQRAAPARKPILLGGAHNSRGGFEMAQRLLKNHPEVTGIFAGNDAIAFGAARALHASGFRIPDDMSLIGFDDIEQASIMHPPLTTISQPINEMGRAAVEILIGQINRKDQVPEHRKFDVRLEKRESCRALPVATSPAVGCQEDPQVPPGEATSTHYRQTRDGVQSDPASRQDHPHDH